MTTPSHNTSAEHEAARVAALKDYAILDTPAEASFDRITRLAQSALDMPIVLVSLVDSCRQWFKSKQGLDADETPRDISFCTHAIEQDGPYVVNNPQETKLFGENPLVLCAPFIRFYAGIPLVTPAGYKIGTLCAIDTKPRELDPAQIGLLEDLAQLVVDELELRRIASTDSLTGARTRRNFDTELAAQVDRARRYDGELSVLVVDLDHFKQVNDTHGHAAGDAVLRRFVEHCRDTSRACDVIGRLGGEEFAIILPETGLDGAAQTAERLRAIVAATPVVYGDKVINVTMSGGVASLAAGEFPEALLDRADSALYASKSGGRNQVSRAEAGPAAPAERCA